MRPRLLRRSDFLLAFFCISFTGILIAFPVLRLLFRAWAVWDWEVVFFGEGIRVLFNTWVLSLMSVLCAGLLGVTAAFLLTRLSFPGRNVLAVLMYLPFSLPPLVGVLAFYYLIGRNGVLALYFERVWGIAGLYPRGLFGILIIHTYSFYVFFYVMVSAALMNLDTSVLEAARTLGASPLRTLFRVTLPLLKPALLGAALLTFMSSAASFSAPLFFGEGFPVLSVRIYEANTQGQTGESLTLTVALACISLSGLLLFRSHRTIRMSASKGVPRPVRSQSGRIVSVLFVTGTAVVLLLPHISIMWLSFIDHRQWMNEIIPLHFTLDNYMALVRDSRMFTPIYNSLWMSGIAAAGVLILAIPSGYLIGRGRLGKRPISILTMTPWALPGTVVAILLLTAFNEPWMPEWTVLGLLPMAYMVRGLPLLTRTAAAAFEPFDAQLLEAGRTLGASPLRCLLRIAFPLLAPPLAAGTALVFATSLGEFVTSILLYRPANMPISVQINMLMRGSGIGTAFAYSVLLMILVGMTFALARRFSVRML